MRNHIAFKFAAVLLAAILLMTSIASGCGILLLSRYDLYNRTAEQGYEEMLTEIREEFAQTLVFRSASVEIGGCSTPLIDDFYGNGAIYTSFRWGRYAYTVRDDDGNILAELKRDLPDAKHYEIPVDNGRFVYLISENNVEETTAERLQIPAETEAAEETAAVTEVTEATEAVTEETAAEETSETEATEEEAAQTEAPAEEEAEESESEEEIPAAAETEAVEQPASEEEPAGEETTAEETAETEAAEETAAEETAETEAAEETAASTAPTVSPETDAKARAAETVIQGELGILQKALPRYKDNPYYTRDQYEEAFSFPYYNYETGAMKDATLCYASTSDYTVDLYLTADAVYDYQMWNLLRFIGPMRGQLFVILGVSFLTFGLLMAYVFCAAGRKKDTGELVPMGFNRMPMDLYTILLGIGILICIWLTSVGTELFQNTQMLQLAVTAGTGFLGCLILICYSMAWAAQIKMGKYFWLKNTLLSRLIRWLGTALVWLGKKLWIFCKRLPAVFCRVGSFCKKWADRLLSLMPVMWQWLASTGVVMLILLLAVIFDSLILAVLGILAAAALAIYGSYCFGILLKGTARMRRGELKTKVESKVLVGSMREFAEELNGLAGVASVAAEKQLKSERMKTELITNVSHDIKTPLTSIINFVDLLEKPHTEQQQEEYLEVLSRQSQRLKKLIDDLMEMSKASTGNMQTEITEVNATEAINQCLGEFADKLEKAELTPVFHPGEQEVTMMADGRLVWRVMSNLLGNAVKYALPGTRVYVDLTELQEDVLISVKNVSRDELNISSDELMERFVRGDASRNTEGSGLGLNIAKSLMELQHGQMELLVDGDLFKVTLIFPKK